MRRGAGVLKIGGLRQAIGRRGEAEEAQHEPVRQRLEQLAFLAKLALNERRARLLVAIRDGHALGVVDEDAEEILLRYRGFQDQGRAEQTEREQCEKRE